MTANEQLLQTLEAALRNASAAVSVVLRARGMPAPMAAVNATMVAYGLLAGDDTAVAAVSPECLAPHPEGAGCIALARLLLSGVDQPQAQMGLAVAEAIAMADPAVACELLARFEALSMLSGDDIATLVSADAEAMADPAWRRRCACIDGPTKHRSTQTIERLGLLALGKLTASGRAILVLASWHPEML